jgi:hypothetical protein
VNFAATTTVRLKGALRHGVIPVSISKWSAASAPGSYSHRTVARSAHGRSSPDQGHNLLTSTRWEVAAAGQSPCPAASLEYTEVQQNRQRPRPLLPANHPPNQPPQPHLRKLHNGWCNSCLSFPIASFALLNRPCGHASIDFVP